MIMHIISRMKSVAVLVVFFAVAGAAHAQSCSWVTLPTAMNFGTYDVFGGASNATTATGSVRCTGNLDVTVSSTTGGAGARVSTVKPLVLLTSEVFASDDAVLEEDLALVGFLGDGGNGAGGVADRLSGIWRH